MSNRIDYTAIEIPVILRDRIASHRLHPRQAYYEVIEEAFELWEEGGGWATRVPVPVDLPSPLPPRRARSTLPESGAARSGRLH